MKAFIVSSLALLVSATAASLIPRQADGFSMLALSNDLDVNGTFALAFQGGGLIFMGKQDDLRRITAKYDSSSQRIERTSSDFQTLWAGNHSHAAMQRGRPSESFADSPFLINIDNNEITGLNGATYPNAWTTCPDLLDRDIIPLYHQKFNDDCTPVKLERAFLS